ncbi:hypothetical protein QVD99_006896 [Batrachochytrium dendrobatidis]|nr:hypothetical protein QVD99_006896 [Batrachochytrium dendrobatidis]
MTESLLQWCTAHSIQPRHPLIDIRQTDTAGFGVYTTPLAKTILPETVLSSISLTNCITAQTIFIESQSNNPYTQHLHQSITALESLSALHSDRIYIMLFLIWGKRFKQYPDMKWSVYFNHLPKTFTTPIYYCPESMECSLLAGTPLSTATLAKQSKLFKESVYYTQAIIALGEGDHHADWCWADAMVWSRSMSFHTVDPSFETKSDLHIVPGIDFCNHDQTPNAYWKVSSVDNCVNLIALDTIDPDVQVTISYGCKPNSELLFIHGFVVDEGYSDCITIPLECIEASVVETDENGIKNLKAFMDRKQCVLDMLGISKMVTIASSQPDNSPNNTNPTQGILDTKGLVTACICCMAIDDEVNTDPSTKTKSQGAICLAECTITPATTVDDMLQLLTCLPNRDILFLRAWTILLQDIEARLMVMEENDPVDEADQTKWSETVKHIIEYRNGARRVLFDAYGVFAGLQEEYAQLPSVQTYLSQMQIN